MTSLMTHITAQNALTPPFGTHKLPAPREAARQFAKNFKPGRLGSWMISSCRKYALRGLNPPFDVEIETGLRARLYPKGNRCEKRAFAGIQIWDSEERRFLQNAIQSGQDSFTFLDIGANVGLYSLYAAHYAALEKRDIHIHAVEPDPENQRRFIDNMAANNFTITLWRAAVSDAAGQLTLIPHTDNRGEIKLSNKAQGDTVEVITLAAMVAQSELTHIDLLKLDIEGHDLRALRHLFENCEQTLYPKRLIIETGTSDDLALMTLCYNQGYVVKGRGRLNMMLERDL